jgi:hypothetical protein
VEEPITPEELQAEIRESFRAAKRRMISGLVVLLVGLFLILVIGVGYLSAEYQADQGPLPREDPGAGR